MKKRGLLFWILVLFVGWLIWMSPDSGGHTVGTYLGWLGHNLILGVQKLAVFLGGLGNG